MTSFNRITTTFPQLKVSCNICLLSFTLLQLCHWNMSFCRMPLTQLPVGSAFCLPEDLALNDYSFCLSKAYWRFDWERQAETAGFHPVIVVHLEQSVSFKLPFLGGVVKTADSSEPKTPKTPKPKDKDGKHTFSCAVDLPDSLVNVKSGFVKYFGDGKNKTAKLTSLGLSSLRRSMVLDAAGVSVPGFPLVMVQLPFKLCPKLTHLSGQEMYQGWSPQESWFWEQPQEYLKKFCHKPPSRSLPCWISRENWKDFIKLRSMLGHHLTQIPRSVFHLLCCNCFSNKNLLCLSANSLSTR